MKLGISPKSHFPVERLQTGNRTRLQTLEGVNSLMFVEYTPWGMDFLVTSPGFFGGVGVGGTSSYLSLELDVVMGTLLHAASTILLLCNTLNVIEALRFLPRIR